MPKPIKGANGKACQGLSFLMILAINENIPAVINAMAIAVVPPCSPNNAPANEATFASPNPSMVFLDALYVV